MSRGLFKQISLTQNCGLRRCPFGGLFFSRRSDARCASGLIKPRVGNPIIITAFLETTKAVATERLKNILPGFPCSLGRKNVAYLEPGNALRSNLMTLWPRIRSLGDFNLNPLVLFEAFIVLQEAIRNREKTEPFAITCHCCSAGYFDTLTSRRWICSDYDKCALLHMHGVSYKSNPRSPSLSSDKHSRWR